MNRRQELQVILENILGSRNVYYQPPEGVKMKFPAIVYALDSVKVRYADDRAYKRDRAYKVTYISKTADDETVNRLLEMPLCRFGRFYTAGGLNHYTFTLYF